MQIHRSLVFKLLLLALCVRWARADCFEGMSDGVKVAGSCRDGKETLLVKDERFTVKFDSESVSRTINSEMALKIGGCSVVSKFSIYEGSSGSMMFDGISLTLPVTATVSKSSTYLKGSGRDDKTIYCEPKFNKVKNGFAIDVEMNFETAAPSFYAIFKGASIYKADPKSALGPVEITFIVAGVVLPVALVGFSIGLWIRVRKFRRSLNAKYPTSMPVSTPRVKKVDETADDQDEDDEKGQREESSLKLVTAVHRPRIVCRPDIEKWVSKSRHTTTVENTGVLVRTAVGEYTLPNWALDKYLKGDSYRILRGLLMRNDAKRRFYLYFGETSGLIFDQCKYLLEKLGKAWLLGTSASDFRKELKRTRAIAADVHLFTSNDWAHHIAPLPWSFTSIWQIGQLSKLEIDIGFTYEPPTFDQLIFMRRELKKERSKGPQIRMPDQDIEVVEHLIKMASDEEYAKSNAPNEALNEFIEGIQKKLRESKY